MKIDLDQIQSYYPPGLQTPEHVKHIIKESIQYRILDYISTTRYAKSLSFIGGTNLRMIYGIDRFSEDLDFDIKNLTREDFFKMTDGIGKFLKNSGFSVQIEDKPKDERLKAFRRNINFPSFLFDNGLSPFREEKFLIKIESQDQEFDYEPQLKIIKGNGLIFNFLIPPTGILCSMKLAALLDRKKGRDFYDVIFLLAQSAPDYSYLSPKKGISNFQHLRDNLLRITEEVNLKNKMRDFEHLLFNTENSRKILLFKDFINDLDLSQP